jgi:hypothetical protein
VNRKLNLSTLRTVNEVKNGIPPDADAETAMTMRGYVLSVM